MKRWLVLAVLYVVAGVLALVLIDASNSGWPVALIVLASLVLGWGYPDGWLISILLPWVLIPISRPFGLVNAGSPGEETGSLEGVAFALAILSFLLILIAAGARYVYDRWRHSRSATTGA